MKNVLIIGAGGSIAQIVANKLQNDVELNVTLFLRTPQKLKNIDLSKFHIIKGDVMDKAKLNEAISGQEMIYVNLSGDLGVMLHTIVDAIKKQGAKHIIFISSIGIYNTPVKPILRPYREGTDIVENSSIGYTILRPSWYTNDNEIDYELRDKGEPENTSNISRESLATVIHDIIKYPEKYKNRNLNISKRD